MKLRPCLCRPLKHSMSLSIFHRKCYHNRKHIITAKHHNLSKQGSTPHPLGAGSARPNPKMGAPGIETMVSDHGVGVDPETVTAHFLEEFLAPTSPKGPKPWKISRSPSGIEIFKRDWNEWHFQARLKISSEPPTKPLFLWAILKAGIE